MTARYILVFALVLIVSAIAGLAIFSQIANAPAAEVTFVSGLTYQDEGTPAGSRPILNCIGADVSCIEDSGNNRMDLTVVTVTPIPPVSTATPIPPVSTSTPAPTATAIPPVSTATPIPPVSTATPIPPVSTATPQPTATPGALARQLQIKFTLESPTSSDNFVIYFASSAATVISYKCIVDPAGSGESVVITPNELDSTGDNPAAIDGTDITCDNDGATDDASISNTSIASGGYISLDYGTVTGTVTEVFFQMLVSIP